MTAWILQQDRRLTLNTVFYSTSPFTKHEFGIKLGKPTLKNAIFSPQFLKVCSSISPLISLTKLKKSPTVLKLLIFPFKHIPRCTLTETCLCPAKGVLMDTEHQVHFVYTGAVQPKAEYPILLDHW